MISNSNALNHWVFEAHAKPMHELFISGENIKITRDDFLIKSLSAANYLSNKNISEGDHVAIYCENKWEYLVVVQALWFIGSVPILFHTKILQSDLPDMALKSKSKFIITDKNDFDSFSKDNMNFIFMDQIFNYNGSLDITGLPIFQLSQKAVCLFTSGSTGGRKLVVHTFHSLLENYFQSNSLFNFEENDLWLLSLPLYHIGGFMIFIRALLSNAKLFIPTNSSHSEIMDALTNQPITHCSIVPTTLQRMNRENYKPNKSIKNIFVGGGPGDASIFNLAKNLGYPITKVYGSTETSSMICALTGNYSNDKINSVGKPIGNTEIIIDKNKSQESASLGEILIKTNSIFEEYYNDKSSTQQAFKDGYYKSGDAGYFDAEGFLYITGRVDNIIVSGGENISPIEIENCIKSIDKISDAAVVGIPDVIWGTAVAAAIIIKDSTEWDEIEVRHELKRLLAPHKIPKKIIFVKSIPRSELGKTNYEALVKLFKD